MSFTFQFFFKTFTTFTNQEEDSKEQYKEPFTKNDSESYSNSSDEDELYFDGDFNGDDGNDVINIDLEEEEDDSIESESEPDTNTEEESWLHQGDEGADTFHLDLDEEETSQEDTNSSNASEETHEPAKGDLIIDGLQHYEAEKSQYIDFWNYDAVNWYTKQDQLSVEDALQSQLIIVDPMGF